jgi:hypothetical protein
VVVAILERDAFTVEGGDAVVRDGDSVGVRRQICQDLLGSAERGLDVAVPVGLGGAGEEQIERGPVLSDVRQALE